MVYSINLTGNKKSADGSILGKVWDFQKEMILHEENQLNVYRKNPQTSACDREVLFFDRHIQSNQRLLMFGSNSYLGASNLERAKQKAIAITKEYGIGSGGVPLLTGTTYFQERLEKDLAKLTNFDDSILFSSGYTANLGVISGLIRPNNLVIHDKLSHASLIDGTILSGAKMLRYKHNDMESLETLLKEYSTLYPSGIMVITDGVFSMDGDIANIPTILELTKKYGALLLIDDAHATGVIGRKGAGTLSHFNIKERDNIVVTGTLSKAIGAVGGYISASQPIIDYLRIYARSNMFSTSLPPSVCASASEVIHAMQESDIVESLESNYLYLSYKLRTEGFNIMNTETAIIPLVIGDQELLTLLSTEFVREGVLINPIFPPAVPPNLTRFRISVMATHTRADIDRLIETIIKVFDKYGLNRFIE